MPSNERKVTETGNAWYRLGQVDAELEIKAAYKRGKRDGRKEAKEQLENRIEKVSATNYHLLIELMTLDRGEAVVGVLLTFDFANSVIDRLRQLDKNSWHASRLKHFINKSDSEWRDACKNLEEELIGAAEE